MVGANATDCQRHELELGDPSPPAGARIVRFFILLDVRVPNGAPTTYATARSMGIRLVSISFKRKTLCWLPGVFTILGVGLVPLAAANDEAAIRHFETRIRPVLMERCYKCHAGGKAKGGLRLDSAASLRRGGESGVPSSRRSPKRVCSFRRCATKAVSKCRRRRSCPTTRSPTWFAGSSRAPSGRQSYLIGPIVRCAMSRPGCAAKAVDPIAGRFLHSRKT